MTNIIEAIPIAGYFALGAGGLTMISYPIIVRLRNANRFMKRTFEHELGRPSEYLPDDVTQVVGQLTDADTDAMRLHWEARRRQSEMRADEAARTGPNARQPAPLPAPVARPLPPVAPNVAPLLRAVPRGPRTRPAPVPPSVPMVETRHPIEEDTVTVSLPELAAELQRKNEIRLTNLQEQLARAQKQLDAFVEAERINWSRAEAKFGYAADDAIRASRET